MPSPQWVPRATPFCFAVTKALNSLYKAELIRNQGPWQDIDAVEVATAEWMHRFNTTQPHSAIDMRNPPSTKAPGSPTSARTTKNNHNRQPPTPDKPTSSKPGLTRTLEPDPLATLDHRMPHRELQAHRIQPQGVRAQKRRQAGQ